MTIARNMELDRLRAVAALLTLYMHFKQVFYPWAVTLDYQGPSSMLDIFSNSWAGVDLFFVISGYIISKTVVGEFDALRKHPGALAAHIKAFYVRRIYRILPVAWAIVALVLVISALFNEGGYFASPVKFLQGAVGIFTYTFNYWFPDHKSAQLIPIAPYWSLSVEEQFYLVFPVFLLLAGSARRRVQVLAGAIAVISLVIRPFLMSDPLHTFFYTQSRCDGLMYGCLLYLFTAQPWFASIRITAGRHRHLGGVVVAVLAGAIAAATAIGFSNTFVIPVVCALSVLLVFMAACEGNLVSFPQPVQAAMDYLGKRSYTIYLLHIPMFYLTTEIMFRYTRSQGLPITPDLWPQYTAVLALLMLVGTECIYRGIERPMIARGRRVAARIMAAPAAANDEAGAHAKASPAVAREQAAGAVIGGPA